MPATWCITLSQSPDLPPVNASHMVYHTITITRPAPGQCQSHGVSHCHNHQICPLSMPVTLCITPSQSPDLPSVNASHMVYHTVTITRPTPCQCQSHGVSYHHNHQTCPLSMPVTWCITPSQSPDLPPSMPVTLCITPSQSPDLLSVNASHMMYHTITITRPALCQCQSHGVSHHHNHQTCPLLMPATWCITPSQSPDLPPVNASHMVYHTVTITRPTPCQCQSHGVSHRHNHQTCPLQCQSHGVSHRHNHQTYPLSMPVTWCITPSQSPDLPPANASHMVYHTVTITRPAPCQCRSHDVSHCHNHQTCPLSMPVTWCFTVTITRPAPCQCQSRGVSHCHNHQTCPLSMPVTWCITLSQSPDLPSVNASHMVYHTVTITRPAPCQCQSYGVSHCHNHQTCPLSMPVTWYVTSSQPPDLPPVNASHMVYHTVTITRPAPCQCQSHGVSHCHNYQICPLSMPVTRYVTSSQPPDLPPVNVSHLVYHTVTNTRPAPCQCQSHGVSQHHKTCPLSMPVTWCVTLS